ncbi:MULTISPECIES: RecQ family ATP-dependent DNA helicase [unclassified Variovorax]|uniref:RecQ family ATP-dependent DNA helicase n=1 Tax=unclassified Variovorax TaxID=663243 RepID=UPI0021088129|nr:MULTISPECIES: RecQ family ATP-dependent DNA helicase [unclassified Variovorax]
MAAFSLDTPVVDSLRARARRIAAEGRLVSIDVEAHPEKGDRIFAVGAVRSDNTDTFNSACSPARAPSVVAALNSISREGRVLLGHNLRRHDLPLLRAQLPQLECLHWAVLDTLELSALAFPRNPYHRLVKGYKLLTDERNNPTKDARVALDVFEEAVEALLETHGQEPWWLALLHFLLRDDEGMATLLAQIREETAPTGEGAARLVATRFAYRCCATRLRALAADVAHPFDGHDPWSVAFALGWIRVSGGNSILPHWVFHELPAVRQLIAELREIDCGQVDCPYCRQNHQPESLLSALFGKPGFRAHPAAPDGTSLQRAIVSAGLARESLLAVLPTGGGKSICYQLPALVHYRRAGRLTIVISPLQSLMRDQVENLMKADIQCAATVNGMLTPLERRDVLDRVRLGDIGILLVSPEQFRSRTFVEAIRLREIAAWVFDEAHCLSKWGHDFRTDYLYVSRFIREQFPGQAPVACFTATAKPDVIEDLCSHFQESLQIELKTFLGGHERTNLSYAVVPTAGGEKPQRIVELLRDGLRKEDAAVVFCATRKSAETLAQIVAQQGLSCACYHGGLSAELRKETQRRFLEGELQVIAATNAFGMGVDKPNVRLVIHAEIPGSLENYLQEAGRAGRDGDEARCVLLFDPQDVETQFRLSSSSQLSQRDFTGLLRALRGQAKKLGQDEIVISAKELLAQSSGTAIDIDAPDASTKVTTAIAWLERHSFLKRNENATKVFPASLRVASLQEAKDRIEKANLPASDQQKFLAVATALFRSDTPEGLSTDELMLDAGIQPEECFRIVHQLAKLGILVNDLGLTVRLLRGVRGASASRLEFLFALEKELLALMAENAPDADQDEAQQHLNLRAVCTELRSRLKLGDGASQVDPTQVRACLRTMADGFGSGNDKRGMIQLQSLGDDTLRVTLRRPWSQIRRICELRRAVAQVTLMRLLAEVPDGVKGACLVECKAQALIDALNEDLVLKVQLREPEVALEHALLYLHQTRVLELDKGRSVFRSAMTIRMEGDTSRRFNQAAFAPLEEFYKERTLQTHVMHEYAKLGVEDPAKALGLVQAYFTLPHKQFIREFFRGRTVLLERKTTDESYRRIVDDLQHPVQEALVTQARTGNHLVLAGPGSGKTRVIVHRIAYLLRVERVSPGRIIALAYNRGAAIQLRRRLLALAGEDARGVLVMTYHAMALRLTGTSLAGAERTAISIDFGKMLQDAVDLLEGRSSALTDADEIRDRLLQGYEYIFVDEYQDIDEQQYALVSALAGRRRADADTKLSIMAVGDDDQNIYSFKGANIEFIRRFRADYEGELTYLVENFRSTQNIISAANHVIQRGADRMKVDHPIRIDARRKDDPPGGRWAEMDKEGRGAVRLITSPADPNRQAQVVYAEIKRIRRIDPGVKLSEIAVLCRTHAPLEKMRVICDVEGLSCEVTGPEAAKGQISLMRTREGWALAQALRRRQVRMIRLGALRRLVNRQRRAQPRNAALQDLLDIVEDIASTLQADIVPAAEVLELFYEMAGEMRRDGRESAVKLMTAHAAKGLEFDHIIVMDCADWRWDQEDERRLLYVAMTRARQSLTLMRAEGGRNPYLVDLGTVDGVQDQLPAARPRHRADLERRYVMLGPASMDIGFAGRKVPADPTHRAIASLRPGDLVEVKGRFVQSMSGQIVGRLATSVDEVPLQGRNASVVAVMVRTRSQTPEDYLPSLRGDEWETPLVEIQLDISDSVPKA